MLAALDHDIQPRAQAALADSPVHALRGLRVDFANDVLHIRGSVPSFYFKQLAQEAVRAVARGVQVSNQVQVS